MSEWDDAPFLISLSWALLDFHKHSRCHKCAEMGFCPMQEAARNRIRMWRRYRAMLR
ncbi:hypothetical protein ACQP2H_10585 [Micromonospora sp. CA-248260]|uniref:hypothetical protein n=1 Tax=Micromonospora sp. CA-248260 TaxID=3239962 RepID=UPI003D8C8180